MQFKLTLTTVTSNQTIPLNYQYELSAWIYKIIEKADAEYSDFLHNVGYSVGRKTFKFFSFSNLVIPNFDIQGDRLQIRSEEITLFISFYVDKAAEHFIIGLFQDQKFSIGDIRSKASFHVKNIESLTEADIGNTVLLRPLSPIVIDEKQEKGQNIYLSPSDKNFGNYLLENLFEKYRATEQVIPPGWQDFEMKFELLDAQKIKSRLVTLKANTKQETKVRGYSHFKFRLTAPKELIELGLLAGIGRMNGQGFGFCELVK